MKMREYRRGEKPNGRDHRGGEEHRAQTFRRIYASGEPCPMCMGAIYWANFKDVYYAYSSEEEQAGLGTSHVYAQLALPREEREIQLQHVERQAETNDAFALWIEKQQ